MKNLINTYFTTTKRFKSHKVRINDPLADEAKRVAMRDISAYNKELRKNKPLKPYKDASHCYVNGRVVVYLGDERELGRMVREQRDLIKRGYRLV